MLGQKMTEVYESYGGYLKDIPKPYKRKFPDERKRRVCVLVTQYYGIGIHFYVHIREEENPIWDEKENCWRIAWDDESEETGGKRFHKRLNTSEQVENFIKETWEKEFSEETHVLEFQYDEDKRYFYKESD